MTAKLDKLELVLNQLNQEWDDNKVLAKNKERLEKEIYEAEITWTELKKAEGDCPTISVVMSLYNSEKHLLSAVNSILEQTFKNFEFIIIDDGSVDSSVEIIKRLEDPRIRLIRQTNHGLTYSLNKGIGLARAQLIARMDHDDISLPSRFEKQLTMMAEQPELGVVSTFFTYMHNNTEEKSITIAFPFKPLDVKRSLYMVNSIAHGSAMFRKSVWEAVGGFNPAYQPPDDYHFWTKVADIADISILPESLYWYRVNPKGMTATMDGLEEISTTIRNEYWQRGYKAKEIRAVLKDAHYYRNLDNPHAHLIYEQYLGQQIHIAKVLMKRQLLRSAIKMTIAVVLLDRKQRRLVLGLAKHTIKMILGKSPSEG